MLINISPESMYCRASLEYRLIAVTALNRLGEILPTDTEDHRSLRHVSIFADLQLDTLARLEARCQWRRLPADSNVISLQDKATEIYFLTEGLARVVIPTARGKDINFRTIFPGDIFGEFAAIDNEPRSATVTLVEPHLTAQRGAALGADFNSEISSRIIGIAGKARHADQPGRANRTDQRLDQSARAADDTADSA